MVLQFMLTVPLDLTVSSNRTAPIWQRQRVKDLMRGLTRAAARNLDPVGSATVYIGITKRTKGRYDPVNLADTFKGCLDELVTMGILDDDDYEHVMGPFLYHRGTDACLPPRTLRALVTLTEYADTPF